MAQLVARLSGGQEVMSSSLVTPTKKEVTFVYQKLLLFLSIAKAMAYHHALACISSALSSISRQGEYLINRRLYLFRNDDMPLFEWMICNFCEIDDIQGYALILVRLCGIISSINKNLTR